MTERSDEIDDGGPAFPTRVFRDVSCSNKYGESIVKGVLIDKGGMSLRDWFAGQALAGIIARYSTDNAESDARVAYQYADAMLKLRDK